MGQHKDQISHMKEASTLQASISLVQPAEVDLYHIAGKSAALSSNHATATTNGAGRHTQAALQPSSLLAQGLAAATEPEPHPYEGGINLAGTHGLAVMEVADGGLPNDHSSAAWPCHRDQHAGARF